MRHRTAGVAAVAAAVLLLLLGGCSGGSASPPQPRVSGSGTATAGTSTPAVPAPRLEMADCTTQIKPQIARQPGGNRDLSFSCGRMRVPVDYAAPDGPSL